MESKKQNLQLKGKKVLIAEDDDFSAQVLQLMVEETKAHVIVAREGEEAVQLFKENKFDLVLLDISLPKLNGYEVLSEIRKLDPFIPVIAQSAHALNNEKEKSILYGFNYYITKPVTMKILNEILGRFLKE